MSSPTSDRDPDVRSFSKVASIKKTNVKAFQPNAGKIEAPLEAKKPMYGKDKFDPNSIPKRTQSAPPELDEHVPPHKALFIPNKSGHSPQYAPPSNLVAPPIFSLDNSNAKRPIQGSPQLAMPTNTVPPNLNLSNDSGTNLESILPKPLHLIEGSPTSSHEPIITSSLASPAIPLSAATAPFQSNLNNRFGPRGYAVSGPPRQQPKMYNASYTAVPNISGSEKSPSQFPMNSVANVPVYAMPPPIAYGAVPYFVAPGPYQQPVMYPMYRNAPPPYQPQPYVNQPAMPPPAANLSAASIPFVPREKKVCVFKDPVSKKPIDVGIVTQSDSNASKQDEVIKVEKTESKVDRVLESTTTKPAEIKSTSENIVLTSDTKIIDNPIQSSPERSPEPSMPSSPKSEKLEIAVELKPYESDTEEEDLEQTVDETQEENLALDFPSSSASSYKSPYSIETLLKLKPSVCPRPQNLPYIKEITEDTDTVKGDYETMVRHSKRNSYADHGKRGSNFKGNTPDHRRTSTVTGRGMRTPSVSTPSVNLNLPQLTKAAFKWRRGLVNSDILGESGKKIKGILNRLNGKNFEILSKEMMDLVKANVTNVDQLGEVVHMLFDTALAQPVYGPVYAEACVLLNANFDSVPHVTIDAESGAEVRQEVTFKKILLSKCQAEFEDMGNSNRALAADSSLSSADKEIARVKAKTRELGNIKFIGELFKRSMVTEKVIHTRALEPLFLLNLTESSHEEELEALCKLFVNCGLHLDTERAKTRMDQYFLKLQSVEGFVTNRLRFMIRDLCELRDSRWVGRSAAPAAPIVTPKTVLNRGFNNSSGPSLSRNPSILAHERGSVTFNNNSNQTVTTPTPGRGRISLLKNKLSISEPAPRVLAETPPVRSEKVTPAHTPSGSPTLSNRGNNSNYRPRNSDRASIAEVFQRASSPLPSDTLSLDSLVPNRERKTSIASSPIMSAPVISILKISDSFMEDNEDFFEEIDNTIKEYYNSQSVEEVLARLRVIDTSLRWSLFISQALIICSEGKERDRTFVTDLVLKVFNQEKAFLEPSTVIEGLAYAFWKIVQLELYVDCPVLPQNLASTLTNFILNGCITYDAFFAQLPLFSDNLLLEKVLGFTLQYLSVKDTSGEFLSGICATWPKNLISDPPSFQSTYKLSFLDKS